MSIYPVSLSSFSYIAPLQRGVSEHKGLDSLGRSDSVDGTGKIRKSSRNSDDDNSRSYDTVIARSGDVVSDYGDVFSPFRAERSENSTQSQSSEGVTTKELTDGEKLQVAKLEQRDAEVKAHEAAHLGAAGGLARGGASYEYQKGPDGRNYAVGGEVSIDTSPVQGNPEAKITKAQQIRAAALAPASPSSQDYKVAAKAASIEAEARQELSSNARDSQETQDSSDSDENQISDKTDNATGNHKSQYSSQTAAMKYVANSLNLSFRTVAGFRDFA